MFAVWSDPEQPLAWKSNTVPLIVGLELVLATLPDDAITVEQSKVPLQLVMTRELATVGTAIANLQREQLKQADQINDIANLDLIDSKILDINAELALRKAELERLSTLFLENTVLCKIDYLNLILIKKLRC